MKTNKQTVPPPKQKFSFWKLLFALITAPLLYIMTWALMPIMFVAALIGGVWKATGGRLTALQGYDKGHEVAFWTLGSMLKRETWANLPKHLLFGIALLLGWIIGIVAFPILAVCSATWHQLNRLYEYGRTATQRTSGMAMVAADNVVLPPPKVARPRARRASTSRKTTPDSDD